MLNPTIQALLFDLDGVLTDSAELHYQAWKRLADEEGIPFDRARNEALRGLSRRDSLQRLLDGRAVDEDQARDWMERKNRYYLALLQHLTPHDLLPGGASLLDQARAAGIATAVVSASHNAPRLLERLGIAARFDQIITGADPGRAKPAPDLFLLAARRLGVPPTRCIGVEDAAAGIAAIHAAGMTAVGIGPVARVGAAETVLDGLDGVDLDTLLHAATWRVRETQFAPAHQHQRETVFTIGNGYLGTRGSLEEGFPRQRAATLIHGLWDDAPVVYTELVNAPNWTCLDIWLDGQPLGLDRGPSENYARYLDLRNGELHRHLDWTPDGGTPVRLHFLRFASLADPHCLVQRISVTPLEQTLRLRVRARLDGHVDNDGLGHWWDREQWHQEDRAFLSARTRHTDQLLAAGLEVNTPDSPPASLRPSDCPGAPGVEVEVTLQPGEDWRLDKLVVIYTGRDTEEPAAAAAAELDRLRGLGFDRLRTRNREAWSRFWQASDVVIQGDDEAQVCLRHALFQLRIAASERDERVSIGAKSLSGFGYRGHVFWDTEIFMLPFFTYTQPAIARNLLLYRWHTLAGARRKAAENGFAGAQYAWESAASGDEVTPAWVPGPRGEELVRIWCRDIELHISADVAFALWQYWQVSGDDDFMVQFGAPILLETALFWESRVEADAPTPGRFSISDVIGPDEYHDHVDNNAFTNRMVAWHLRRALDVLTWLEQHAPGRAAELRAGLDLQPDRLDRWGQIADNLVFLHDEASGLIEQFAGFFQRREVDWDAFAGRTRSMQVLLGIEGANAHQVLKQPDVILLLTLLEAHFGEKEWRANWDYYVPRTDHSYGSSLGPAIHAWAACNMDEPEMAYEHFMRAARADLADVRGNAGEGIHAASAGGLWQAAVFGFAGLRVAGDDYRIRPRLPPHWKRLAFRFRLRGVEHRVDIAGK